jgi:hypothetical protein
MVSHTTKVLYWILKHKKYNLFSQAPNCIKHGQWVIWFQWLRYLQKSTCYLKFNIRNTPQLQIPLIRHVDQTTTLKQ